MNITEKFLERLRPNSERQTRRDDELTGFGVRVEPGTSGGRKSFFYNAKVGGRVVFKSLGEWPALSVKDAREEAKEWAGKASAWKKAGCPEDANPFAKPKKVERTTTPIFRELVEAYIKNHLLDPEVGALNKERAEYDVRLLVKNYFESWLDRSIDKITPDDVLSAKNAAKGRYIQNSVVELARRLYTWSAGSENGKANFWVVSNPAKDIALNKPKPRKRFLQPDELLKFNEELKKEQHADTRDALALLLATGARKSNVYAMRWENISFELRNWHVPMSKSGSDYEVALTPAAMEVLERRRREIPQDQPWVFPAPSKSGHITDIKKRWGEFRKRAGIPDVRLHDLRRTKGSYAALSGESLQKIGALLGHQSLGSTHIYARLNQESVREASLASDAAMKSVMEQAKKRIKREARKPKLLRVANG
jgi:integrase